MIIGVTDWVLDGQGPDAPGMCAELGFGALQVGVGGEEEARNLGDERWLGGLGEAAARHGVKVSGIALNVLEIQGTEEPERARALELVGRAAKAARRLGASLVYVPGFGKNRIGGGDGVLRAAEFLKAACRIGVAEGVIVASENTLGVEDNLRLANEVGESNYRVLLDTYNARVWGHEFRELAAALGAWMSDQTHVKDGFGGALGAAPLGEGDGETGAALDALAEIGYGGGLFLENDYRGENRGRPYADIEYVRRQFYAAPHVRKASVKPRTGPRS